MPDLIDSFITGVPQVKPGAPSIFGRGGVSPQQATQIVRNRVANQGLILGTRAKLNEFRDREQAAIQGRAAMDQLTRLDPQNDPQYEVKKADIVAKYPSSTLDATVNNFLGIQEGIFSKADQERRISDAERRDELLAHEADRRENAQNRTQALDRVEVAKKAQLDEELAVLPDSLLERFTTYRDNGLTPERAMAKVKEEAASAGALNELIESGFDPNSKEIVGLTDEVNGGFLLGTDGKPIDPGVYDPKTGAVDPRKVSALKSRVAREKQQKEEAERIYKDKENRLDNLTGYYKSLELSEDTELKKRVMDSITKLQEDMGLLPPVASEDGGPMTDTARTIPAKKSADIRDTDRYLPKTK